jgi:hypothetical protein
MTSNTAIKKLSLNCLIKKYAHNPRIHHPLRRRSHRLYARNIAVVAPSYRFVSRASWVFLIQGFGWLILYLISLMLIGVMLAFQSADEKKA